MYLYFSPTSNKAYRTLPLNIIKHICEDCEEHPVEVETHNHYILEINTILEGEMIFTVDKNEFLLQPGDSVLCNPFSVHSGKWIKGGKGVFLGLTIDISRLLSFSNSVLFSSLEGLINKEYCFESFYDGWDNSVTKAVMEIERAYTFKKTNPSECETLMLVYKLLAELFENHYKKNESDAVKRDQKFMIEVAKYINNNYKSKIITSDIAATFHMDSSTFCHIFKRNFGKSFKTFLCETRITDAAENYINSSMSVSEICEAVGFCDYVYFSKMFKKYIGISPARYFGKWKK